MLPTLVVHRTAGPRRRVGRVGLDVLDVSGLALDTIQPRTQRPKRRHVETGLVREMRVAVDRHVRDRVTAGDEELANAQVAVEELEHLLGAGGAADRGGV